MSAQPKSKNPNHPQRGSSIKVEPIRSIDDISKMKTLLAHSPRDLALFTLGINTALRATELVSLTVGQVRHLLAGDDLIVKQSKNKKYRSVTLNQNAYEAVQLCLSNHPQANDPTNPLFYSKVTGRKLQSNTISKYMKRWCRLVNLEGNYASHTMRKTFGYHVYRNAGRNGMRQPRIAELMTAYGHATERQTLEYLCIQDRDISRLYMENGL